MLEYIEKLRAKRDALKAEAQTLTDEAVSESRDLTDDEDSRVSEVIAEVRKLDDRIKELTDEELRSAKVAEARTKADSVIRPGVRVASEARTYEKGNTAYSYMSDLVLAEVNHDTSAQERLSRHAVENRDLTTTSGASAFVPPAYLVNDFIELARAGRVTADLVTHMPLPQGHMSLVIPKIATGVSVASQQGEGTAVAEVDLTDGSITVPVVTIAGQQDLSLQLLEQGPAIFEQIVIRELAGAYANELDRQVLNGTGTNQEMRGILQTSGISSVAYTDGSPTVGELYAKTADAIQRIHSNRFQPATHIVVSPRRWGWLTAAVDSQNRPLVVPSAQGPMNAAASQGPVSAEGYAGSMQGLPVFVDANIPTNYPDFASTPNLNTDPVIVMRASDHILFEGPLHSRVLKEVLSSTLQVRIQLYAFTAFTAARFPKSTSVISGSGLTTPTF
jgi:HK97 family phage major capsid protein